MIDYVKIAEKIKEADAILVGASNGFSITEGLHIFAQDRAFDEVFGDFKSKYGVRSILQGVFYQWRSDEERWAFMSRLAERYSIGYEGSPLMDAFKKLIAGKPYFIVTSNGENHFELAGIPAENILEIEGSWKEMSCLNDCHDGRYPTWDILAEIAKAQKDCRAPSDLVPRCPKCGGSMGINFSPKREQIEAYKTFVAANHNKKLLVLEFGIGARNRLIKEPLMNLVYNEPNASYITFNKGELYIPNEISEKSIGVDGLLGEILPEAAKRCV